jgi:OOP family OmpA-OmpF porin
MSGLKPDVAVLAAASFAGMATIANAQGLINVESQNRGFYIGLGVGPNFQETNHFRGGGIDSNTSYETGFAGVGSLGHAFGNGLRFEIEPGYRRNEVNEIAGGRSRAHHAVDADGECHL